jgi:hypothetical protein
MKLNENQNLYIRSMGKALKVTGIFTDSEKTNNFCNGTNNGVVAEFGKFIFTADMGDRGVSISAVKQDDLLSLIDGAMEIVEIYTPYSPAQIKWKNDWMIKARKALKN